RYLRPARGLCPWARHWARNDPGAGRASRSSDGDEGRPPGHTCNSANDGGARRVAPDRTGNGRAGRPTSGRTGNGGAGRPASGRTGNGGAGRPASGRTGNGGAGRSASGRTGNGGAGRPTPRGTGGFSGSSRGSRCGSSDGARE